MCYKVHLCVKNCYLSTPLQELWNSFPKTKIKKSLKICWKEVRKKATAQQNEKRRIKKEMEKKAFDETMAKRS